MASVAVVGIAAKLPSGEYSSDNLDHVSFQFLLKNGESYERIPLHRFNIDALQGSAQGQVLPTHGSFLKGLDQFDHVEFGITAKDARLMTVSSRVLLELSLLAFLDASVDYRGKNIGCFMAGVPHDMFALSGQDESESKGSFAFGPAMTANRISYHLDLRGPSVPTDTACSSSLTATHLAVQSISTGECETAVVGGAQINLRFTEWLTYTQGGVLSSDGKCKPWDASADGFGRAEGAVVIVLKALDAAVRDDDKIYATILGTAINSCGSLMPVNAPVASAQELAMRRALEKAQRDPCQVDFLELHATGTARGDPTEANWVGRTFKRDGDILVGSVKGNIGHSEITAFLASLSKVCSIFTTGLIPPNVNLARRNPDIHWDKYRLRVASEITHLPRQSSTEPSLVAMTSSGIGGANGSCIIEGPPLTKRHSLPSFWRVGVSVPQLLIAGGLSPRSAEAVIESLKTQTLVKSLDDLALTYGRRARSMTWRAFSIVDCAREETKFSKPILSTKNQQPVIFVFSGQGPQHLHMGREMYRTCRSFRETVDEMDAVYERITGKSLIRDWGLFGDSVATQTLLPQDIWPISVTLPSLTVIHCALFDALTNLGVIPAALIGHSAGETAVLYASGAGSKAMVLELSIARGKAMTILESKDGAMAAVNSAPEHVLDIITSTIAELGPAPLEIGCFNALDAVTLSGSAAHVDRAVQKAKDLGIFAAKLRTRVPVHSAMMDLCEDEYRSLVANVFSRHRLRAPDIPVYSSATGRLLDVPLDAEYFWLNTRHAVRFTDAVEALAANYSEPTFIELGPHPVLTSYLTSLVPSHTSVVCPLRRPNLKKGELDVEVESLLVALGQLITVGHNCVNIAMLVDPKAQLLQEAPSYPFNPKEVPYWVSSVDVNRYTQDRHGPLNYRHMRVNASTHPSLAQHVIKGEPIMPAAAYIEMALEFGARKLWDVEFLSIIGLNTTRPLSVEVSLDAHQWAVRTSSASDVGEWPTKFDRLHSRGFLTTDVLPQERAPSRLNLRAIEDRCQAVPMHDFYEKMRYFADYGQQYCRIEWMVCGMYQDKLEALVRVRGWTSDIQRDPRYILHPAILDAAIHVIAHPSLTGIRDPVLYALPSRVKVVIVHDTLLQQALPEVIYTHATCRSWTPYAAVWDCVLVDTFGTPLCTLQGLEVATHGHLLTQPVSRRFEVTYKALDVTVPLPTMKASSALPTLHVADLCRVVRDPSDSDHVFVFFRHRSEVILQAAVAKLDEMSPLTIWFLAPAGLHADAALGFSRSFRREYLAWRVRLVIYSGLWAEDALVDSLQTISAHPHIEDEVHLDIEGRILGARALESSAPSSVTPFHVERPWQVWGSRVQQTSMPTPSTHEALVDVHTFSSGTGSAVRTFMGSDTSSALVIGLTAEEPANFLLAHKASLFKVPRRLPSLGPSILALVITALALDLRDFSDPELRNLKVVVTEGDSPISQTIIEVLEILGASVTSLSSSVSAFDICMIADRSADLVVSGYQDAASIAALQRCLTPAGDHFLWNDASTGIPSVLMRRPWRINKALEAGMRFLMHSSVTAREKMVSATELLDMMVPSRELVRTQETLFDPRKTYLLIGGIGSLGCQIATWMYENGARQIVMTSRSGKEGLHRRHDTATLRFLTYLESLRGLALNLHAADASSEQSMKEALARHPCIAGCMLLSGLLVDATFQQHSEESYYAAFPSKTGAFAVVEKLLNINAMDWLVGFSSVSALFGNAGQTNYASANCILHGLTRQYRNAFSLIVPFIKDSFVAQSENASRMKHMSSWGLSVRELCLVLEDGLRQLANQPIDLYIPDLPWDEVSKHFGVSKFFEHLLSGPKDVFSAEKAPHSLASIIAGVLDVSPHDFSAEVPLIAYGLDSLSAARLSFALRGIVPVTQMQLLGNITTSDLRRRAEAAARPSAGECETSIRTDVPLTTAQSTGSTGNITEHYAGTKATMIRLVEELTAGLSPQSFRADASEKGARSSVSSPDTDVSELLLSQEVVLLTGTTGALGAALLAHLAGCSQVAKIFALNRPGTSGSVEDRQAAALREHGLVISDACAAKIVYIEAFMHNDRLGVSPDMFNELLSSVTSIVHAAWPVLFSLPLAAFIDSLKTLQTLLCMAMTSALARLPRFVFISSYSVLTNAQLHHPAKEEMCQDPGAAIGLGYSESKWIAEQLVHAALVAAPALRATCIRTDTLSGSASGAWDRSHWAPSIINAASVLGCVPDLPGDIYWLPMSVAAQAVADVALCSARSLPPVMHLTHPHPTTWTRIFHAVAAHAGVALVPYARWIDALENKLNDRALRERERARCEPALKLAGMFRERERSMADAEDEVYEVGHQALMFPRLDMSHMLACASGLRSAAQLNERDVNGWMYYWERA